MAEQWQALAVSANAALAHASYPNGTYLYDASAALTVRMLQTHLRLQDGGNVAALESVDLDGGNVAALESVDLDGPTAMLGSASRGLASYIELHNRAVRVLSIYGGTLGVLTDAPLWERDDLAADPNAAGPRWQRWVQRTAHALQCADHASREFRSVAAYDLATVDAFAVARSFPENSPSFTAWLCAADKFALRALSEAREATVRERTMYDAVGRELLVGLAIANP